ncbi:MAG: Gfo/Idh/MocA family oxidoreductase [Ruminococcaceae bacterium]|nr:Gfo/Idh/MocA family oxidoreductase [Oscillospiraceae bacterium]
MSDAVLSQFTQAEEEKAIDTSRKLRFGIIGTGWIAEAHVQAIKEMPDAVIVAGADLIEGKAEAFFEKWGVPGVRCYPDHKSMIDNEELDCVCVCTYNKTHAECTIYALEHGLHVMLEKPMCVTQEEAEAIIKAEKKSGKILTVGFQPRMDANMQKIKEIVQSGELGKIYYMQTGGGRRRGIPGKTFIEEKTAGVGALGDIGCYSLDVVLNAIGYPKPLTVSGYKSKYFGTDPKTVGAVDAARFDVDDFAAAFVRLEGDIILDFRISWAMNMNTPGDTIILGTEGGLRIPSTDCWNGTFPSPMTVYKNVGSSQVEYKIPLVQNTGAAAKGLFYAKIRSFMDAILNNGVAPVPTSQIYYNQAIISGIVKSAELGREIELDIPRFEEI